MPSDNIISRTDASALIPTEVSTEVIKALTEQSAALALCRRLGLRSAASVPGWGTLMIAGSGVPAS